MRDATSFQLPADLAVHYAFVGLPSMQKYWRADYAFVGLPDVVVSVFTDKWSPIISEDTDVVVSIFTDKWSPIISEDTDNNVRKILMLLSVSSLTNGVRLSVKTLTTT